MSAHRLVSIDIQVEVSIGGSSKVSVEEVELLSIDIARLSLKIVLSKRAGSENNSDFSLVLLVLLGMHLKRSRK
ncbi:hypothetical protein IGI04_029883 [Brassica rapa subsp. trilocularis]|uniref:Uncharacterized protein n=1 Tax=Brassica rapa subsp. trilocularis TaxID=1813537 RepID=A0ABQ7LP75_BRACM|nr:hypothetical protein IGI04_029883 [Brassica rapa subsp. trilocularis]